jgi:DNA ligase 1
MNFDPNRKLMLAAEVKTFEELPESLYRVSIKLDGIRAYVALSPEGKPVVYSRTHKPIPNLQVQRLFGMVELLGFEGELLLDPASDSFSAVQSVVMSRENTSNSLCLLLFPFSHPRPVDTLPPHVGMISERFISTSDLHAFWVSKSESTEVPPEGLMFRRATFDPTEPYKAGRSTIKEGYLIKWKAKKSSEYTVVGFEEAIDKHGYPKGELGALVLRDHPADPTFKAGTGFSAEQRKAIWAARGPLKGKSVEVEYMNLHESGIPRHPVFKGFRENV